MPRVSVTISNSMYSKLVALAEKENQPLSTLIMKMAELGLFYTENNRANKSSIDKSEIDIYCQKLLIQVSAIIKNMAVPMLGWDKDTFDKLNDETIKKYNTLIGIKPDDL